MFFRNSESIEPLQSNNCDAILLILITFIIGLWILYISTREYQKESIRLVSEVITMRKRIGSMCNEIGAITKHCNEQYNMMDDRLKDLQVEIEKHLVDIDQIEKYITDKTNLSVYSTDNTVTVPDSTTAESIS